MIRENFILSESEKKRILSMHRSASKNLYLKLEQKEDTGFGYVLIQPERGVQQEGYFNPKNVYILAYDRSMNGYTCEITERDEEGYPTDVKVNTEYTIPKYTPGSPETNEFFFGFIKRDKKSWDIEENEQVEYANVGNWLNTGIPLYAIWYEGKPQIVPCGWTTKFNWGSHNWEMPPINFNDLEVGKEINLTPFVDIVEFGKKYGYGGFPIYSTFPQAPWYKGRGGDTPPPPPPAEPVPLGDFFDNNISTPNEEAIISNEQFQKFKKFAETADLSKYNFFISASASKCRAGYKEADSSMGMWKDDKTNYAGVEVDPNADKADLGNLNLTKARAQNLKNFLIKSIPNLKNARFKVVAFGSLGTCGTEENNRKFRKVDLSVDKLK